MLWSRFIHKTLNLSDGNSIISWRKEVHATDKSFAPKGCDSFYVLCPVPNLQGHVDWSKEGIKLQNRIIEALEKTILPDLKNNICDDFFMTPLDFKNDYRSAHGAGFSIAPIFSAV